ncbi:ABC transporter permease [Deinococcus pimensis]|uniref:ABC transporter permease n=1 Tax=Deinococcus pimensis TaxID=309888 RepID=UPI0004AE516D|nr:ABC-2 family transporter protein [Deinococcus pimensis]
MTSPPALPSASAPGARGELLASARLFVEVARLALRRQLAYRAAAFAGLVTNLFFGLLRSSVLLALLAGQDSAYGLGARDLVTYTALTQGLIVYLSLFGWWDLMQNVYRGDVATDLMRPMSFYGFWLAQDAGRALAGLLMRGLPLVLAYALFFPIVTPTSPTGWAAFLVSLLLAGLLSFAYRFLVNLAAFWSPDARGIGRFAFTIVGLLSGFLMPLAFLPGWLREAAGFTPFPHMVGTVVDVWLGKLQGAALARALCEQAAWTVALVLLGRWLLGRARRRLEIGGG